MQKNLNVIKAKRWLNSDGQDSLNLMMYHYEVLEMQEVNLVTQLILLYLQQIK